MITTKEQSLFEDTNAPASEDVGLSGRREATGGAKVPVWVKPGAGAEPLFDDLAGVRYRRERGLAVADPSGAFVRVGEKVYLPAVQLVELPFPVRNAGKAEPCPKRFRRGVGESGAMEFIQDDVGLYERRGDGFVFSPLPEMRKRLQEQHFDRLVLPDGQVVMVISPGGHYELGEPFSVFSGEGYLYRSMFRFRGTGGAGCGPGARHGSAAAFGLPSQIVAEEVWIGGELFTEKQPEFLYFRAESVAGDSRVRMVYDAEKGSYYFHSLRRGFQWRLSGRETFPRRAGDIDSFSVERVLSVEGLPPGWVLNPMDGRPSLPVEIAEKRPVKEAVREDREPLLEVAAVKRYRQAPERTSGFVEDDRGPLYRSGCGCSYAPMLKGALVAIPLRPTQDGQERFSRVRRDDGTVGWVADATGPYVRKGGAFALSPLPELMLALRAVRFKAVVLADRAVVMVVDSRGDYALRLNRGSPESAGTWYFQSTRERVLMESARIGGTIFPPPQPRRMFFTIVKTSEGTVARLDMDAGTYWLRNSYAFEWRGGYAREREADEPRSVPCRNVVALEGLPVGWQLCAEP